MGYYDLLTYNNRRYFNSSEKFEQKFIKSDFLIRDIKLRELYCEVDKKDSVTLYGVTHFHFFKVPESYIRKIELHKSDIDNIELICKIRYNSKNDAIIKVI